MNTKQFIPKIIKLAIIITFVVVLLWIVLSFFFTRKIRIIISLPKKQTIELYNGIKDESDIDTIWCATFDLAWNELIEKIGTKVEFENYESDFVNRLNEQNFTKDMINENNYYIKADKSSSKLKTEILQSVKGKFGRNEKSILDRVNFESDENKMTVYSVLNKEFDFTEKFYTMGTRTFGNTAKEVKCFGIPFGEKGESYENIEVMYFDRVQDETIPSGEQFISAVRLNTEENQEVIFVATDVSKNFEELYEEIMKLEKEYTGAKELEDKDMFVAPYVRLNMLINYAELCGKEIKGTNGVKLENAIQSINFSMNPNNNKIYHEVEMVTDIMGSYSYQTSWSREFNFCNQTDECYMFVKEKDKDKPYLSIKLNENFLETIN